MEAQPSPLSSRPERTRISCHAALDKAAYAPFRKERRMKFANAIKFHRKSGGAQWRDLQFSGPLVEMFFDRLERSFVTELLRLCFSPLPALRYFADPGIARDDQFAGTQSR